MKLPDPRPCKWCKKTFQPKARAVARKVCYEEKCLRLQKLFTKIIKKINKARFLERKKNGEKPRIYNWRDKPSKEWNGRRCIEDGCNKKLYENNYFRCPECQRFAYRRLGRTDGDYLYCEGGE